MIDRRILDDLAERLSKTVRDSPVSDFEKNLRALLSNWADRVDLVAREDFEVQRRLLQRAQAKLAELEARIGELEGEKHRR